jgi:hypothetical protein
LSGPGLRRGHPLGRVAPAGDARDALAHDEVAAAGVEHLAGEVDPEVEGRLGLHLVLPAAQQQVGEGDPDAVHLDQHVVGSGGGLGHVVDDDVERTGGRDDLGCAHAEEASARARPGGRAESGP